MAEIKEEFERNTTVYDIEPDKKDSREDRKMLPRRVHFYYGKLTAGNLSPGRGAAEAVVLHGRYDI